jgi:hypothetical protein
MRRALIVAAVVAAAPGLALAAATAELAKAKAEYQRSEYQRTVEILAPVLDDARQSAHLSQEELIDAHKLLGLSYFFLAQPARPDDKVRLLEDAGGEFAALLFLDPDYVLDAAVEGPEAAGYFDEVKRDQRAKLDEIRRQRAADEERKRRPRNERVILRVERDPSPLSNWVPFAYPQFRNGQGGKGAVLGGLQGITFATSGYFYLQHALKYGWPVGELPLDPDEVDTIRTEQFIQIGAGVSFLLLYAYGVWDGYRHQRPNLVETVEIRPIVYDDESPARPPATQPVDQPGTRLFPTPSAPTLGATWEF